jgi:hypothetical protein
MLLQALVFQNQELLRDKTQISGLKKRERGKNIALYDIKVNLEVVYDLDFDFKSA